MQDRKLPFPATAPVVIAVTCDYDWRSGWRVRVSVRRSLEEHFHHSAYEALSGPELVDVVSSELEGLVVGREPPANA